MGPAASPRDPSGSASKAYGKPWSGELICLNHDGHNMSITARASVGRDADVTIGGASDDTELLLLGVVAASKLLVAFPRHSRQLGTFNIASVTPDVSPLNVGTIAVQAEFLSTTGERVMSPVSHVSRTN